MTPTRSKLIELAERALAVQVSGRFDEERALERFRHAFTPQVALVLLTPTEPPSAPPAMATALTEETMPFAAMDGKSA